MENQTDKMKKALDMLTDQIEPARVLARGPKYESARQLWNTAVGHQPALIVRCNTPEEVQTVVHVARQVALSISVLGGGHDWAGRALRPGGIVIDMSEMRQVSIQGSTAVLGGGARAGDVVAAAEPAGLTTVTGTSSSVGMAAFALGGGYGPLSGHLGMGVDNILGVEIVLADGRLIWTDLDHDPDLFWALRGGGGNFGVITALRMRLHPIEKLLSGVMLFPLDQGNAILKECAHILTGAPEELTVQTGIVSTPEQDPCILVAPTWCGDLDRGAAIIDKFTTLGTPVLTQAGPMSHSDLLSNNDSFFGDDMNYFIRTCTLDRLTPEVISALVTAGKTRTSPFCMVGLHHFHGAPTRIPVDSTAFGIRREHFVVEIIGAWDSGDPTPHQEWAKRVSDALAPHALPGGYPNLLGPLDRKQADQAYGPNASRLLNVKAHYDPNRVFTAIPLPNTLG